MYYFKANDKNETEYGPLDADQIREWVREKRMDGHSLVRKSPYEEWRPLNQIEELSYICREAPESPVPSTPLTIPAVVPVAAVAPAGQPIKPGKLQAVAIMTLVGGIIGVLVGLGYGCYFSLLTLATFGFGAVLMILPLYALIFWNNGNYQRQPDVGTQLVAGIQISQVRRDNADHQHHLL